jgi:RNA polymerase sigma-70 factor (ECF subfamily)
MQNGTNPAAALSYKTGSGGIAGSDDDAVLVSSARQGDLDAFETLVNRHQRRQLNIAYRITNDYEEACEVAQDAFLSAYRNLGYFRGESKFTTWLTAITVNLSKNRLKQMKSRANREAFSLDEPVVTNDSQMIVDPPSKDRSALEKLEQQEIQQKVQNCVKALDADFREVLILRDLQDFSYDEIGNILKIPQGTIKSRLFRAREMVKDCLKRVMGEF